MNNFYFVLFFILVAIIGVTLTLYVALILEIDSLQSQIETQPTSKQDIKVAQMFSANLTDCILGDPIVVKGTITNNDSIYHSPVMRLSLTDSNKNILGFIEHIVNDVGPDQTISIEHTIPSHPDAFGCSIDVTSAD